MDDDNTNDSGSNDTNFVPLVSPHPDDDDVYKQFDEEKGDEVSPLGSAPDGEPMDIDAMREATGTQGDENGPHELGTANDLNTDPQVSGE